MMHGTIIVDPGPRCRVHDMSHLCIVVSVGITEVMVIVPCAVLKPLFCRRFAATATIPPKPRIASLLNNLAWRFDPPLQMMVMLWLMFLMILRSIGSKR